MSTLIATAPAIEHSLSGHPESPARMRAIVRLLEEAGVLSDVLRLEPQPASEEQLTRVHSPSLLTRVGDASARGGGFLDADTYVTGASYELACLAAGSACAAADYLMAGRANNGFVLVRPPGHHAEHGSVGGFCLFNNIAVAARQAQSKGGARRVLIVDIDVHHGNGTQEIFYRDPSVLFVSLHLFLPFFYPGTGGFGEIGSGAGKGQTVNVPFGSGFGDHAYVEVLQEVVQPMAERFGPDLILVSAGFDAHWIDPLASAGLSLTGYAKIARRILGLANQLCDGRVLFILEGGYHREALAYGVLNVLYALLGRDQVEDPLGPGPGHEPDVWHLINQLQSLHLLK